MKKNKNTVNDLTPFFRHQKYEFLAKYGNFMKDDFLWLQQWFQDHCNGIWERDSRIHLGTLDNPGWLLTVDLEDTELATRNFQEINDIYRSEERLDCL